MPYVELRSYLLVPSFIVLCSLAAGVFAGGGVSAARTGDAVNQSLKSFTKVYSVVEQNFADPVKPDKAIYKGAIPGMLRTLDPHSNFFDPQAITQRCAKISAATITASA